MDPALAEATIETCATELAGAARQADPGDELVQLVQRNTERILSTL